MTRYAVERVSAGSYDLNKWLYGGYEKGVITMIAGPAGSGKTNFVILSACSQARKGNKVIFVDTEGGFSSDRVRQIVGDKIDEILQNILLIEPKSFEEQEKCFSEILRNLKKEQVGLIIVDGISMLYRLELGGLDDERVKEVNKEIARQMRVLAEIARSIKIPVLITNQVYRDFVPIEKLEKGVKRETNLVGGDLFKYWSKCIIVLSNEGSKRKARLVKHRSLEEKEIYFEIKDKGVFKKGWF